MNERNKLLDYMRGITVFLMVLGHCIQIGSGNEYIKKQAYFDDTIYQIIYTFHMPMFMIISGFLYGNTLNKYSLKKGICRNIKKYLSIILIVWIIKALFEFSYKNIIEILKNFYLILWFIWALLFISTISLIIEKIVKHSKLLIYCLMILSFFFLPDCGRLSIYKYMFPYYIIGLYIYKLRYKQNNIKNSKFLLYSCIVIYIALLFYYNRNTFIYTSGITLLGNNNYLLQLIIDLHRYIIGACGCYIFYRLCRFLLNKKFLEKVFVSLGIDSLYIYVITTEFLNSIIKKLTFGLTPNYFLNLLEAVISVAVTLLVKILIQIAKEKFKYKKLKA